MFSPVYGARAVVNITVDLVILSFLISHVKLNIEDDNQLDNYGVNIDESKSSRDLDTSLSTDVIN